MVTVLIILVICTGAFLLWLLFAPIIIRGDSRVPFLSFRYWGIGQVAIFYKEEWTLQWRFFFFGKTMNLEQIANKRSKQPQKKKKAKRRKKGGWPAGRVLRIIGRMAATFTVKDWQWALDTGDHTLNAKLYPVNFIPGCYGHLQVNFNGQNYLHFHLRNRLWKLIYAWLRH